MTLRSARYLVSALLAILTGLAPAAWSAVPAPASVLVLDGVTVVDTRTGGLTPGRAVVVEGGRIAAILPAGAARRRGAQVVDARGEFLVPGFNDMHAHPLNAVENPERQRMECGEEGDVRPFPEREAQRQGAVRGQLRQQPIRDGGVDLRPPPARP